MEAKIAAIRAQRLKINAKVSDYQTRGPKLSQTHHQRIVDATLLTFTVLYKLAVYIRGDYDERTDDMIDEAPELIHLLAEFTRCAEKAEKASEEGHKAMSKLTETMMELRSVDIAKLIKTVEQGKRDAQQRMEAARAQMDIQQGKLDQARWSLRTARDTLSTSERKLRETEESREQLSLAKNLSWIIPFVGIIVNSADAIGGFERDLRNSIDQLHHNIDEQTHNVATWQSEISNTESLIRTASAEVDVYSHAMADLSRIEGNCSELVKMSQQTEKQLVQIKITMRRLCVIATDIHGKARDSSYVTEKSEFVGVILDVLEEGLIDYALRTETALVVSELKAEDTTGVLASEEIQKKLNKLSSKGITF